MVDRNTRYTQTNYENTLRNQETKLQEGDVNIYNLMGTYQSFHWDLDEIKCVIFVNQHIEAWTKWLPFCKQHLHVLFLERKCLNLE